MWRLVARSFLGHGRRDGRRRRHDNERWNLVGRIGTPVLHVASDEESSLIPRIGAMQGAWAGLSTPPAEARERIDRPDLRAALCRRGLLDVL